MDFEIEGEAFDEYDFEPSWNKSKMKNYSNSKGFFGGARDDDGNDSYSYDYEEDFSSSNGKKLSTSGQTIKNNSSTITSSKSQVSSVKNENMSSLDNAKNILARYSTKGNMKQTSAVAPKRAEYVYDEDDITVGSSASGGDDDFEISGSPSKATKDE